MLDIFRNIKLGMLTASALAVVSACSIGSIVYAEDVKPEASNNESAVFISLEAEDDAMSAPVDNIVNLAISEDETIRVGISDVPTDVEIVNTDVAVDDSQISVKNTDSEDLKVKDVTNLIDEVKADIAAEEEAKRKEAELRAKTYSDTQTQGGLVDILNPDANYGRKVVNITGNDRYVLERLVMGEAGNQGFVGAALVAQTIKDLYVYGGFNSIEEVRVNCGFSASLKWTPNQNVIDAVNYVFDQGGYAVKHRLFYFYAPRYSRGSFHETQNHIITYMDHKFFDRWY